ncbi:hypothetical protein HK28_11970 [Acetobacter sp. DsW_063]|nr:hypothetical protein HK28_11970 [Acetobacter sp. DsW_063]
MLPLSGFLTYFASEASGLTLHVINVNYQKIGDAFHREDADLTIAAIVESHESHHSCTHLYRDHFVTLFNAQSFGYTESSSLDRYLSFRNLLVSPRGYAHGLTERMLSEMGASRKIISTLQRFSTLPFVIRGTPFLCNVPSVVARYLKSNFDLSSAPLPFESPEFDVAINWHKSIERDNAFRE